MFEKPRPRGRLSLAAAGTFPVLLLSVALPRQVLAKEESRKETASTPRQSPVELPPATVEGVARRGVVWKGARGITETVAQIMARQQERDKAGARSKRYVRRHPRVRLKSLSNPLSPPLAQWPPPPQGRSRTPAPLDPQTVGTSFLGIELSEAGAVPPDSMGDVGPTQVVVATNGRIKVFNKQGVLGGLDADINTFFSSVSDGFPTSDPRVRYDRLSGRWFVTIINIPLDFLGNATGPNRVLIAVSSTSTITNASSFTFFQFQQDQVGPTPNADTDGFADYDTLGVDKFALYIGANMFNQMLSAFIGTTGFVVNKADLLAGTLTVTAFRQLADDGTSCQGATPDGVLTPQGVHNDDPGATEGYFIGVDLCQFGELTMVRVSDPGGTPSLSGNMVLTVPATSAPISQVQAFFGPTYPTLDALDDRLFAASVHTNKIAGGQTLWTAHNIEVDANGVGQSGGGRNGSRWYEIGDLTSTPTLVQSGTLFDPTTVNPLGFWIPSVAMSGQGHMAIASSRAGLGGGAAPRGPGGGHPSVGAAGRLRTDTLGETQPHIVAVPGDGNYDTPLPDDPERWGDYSQTVVDPTDDQTLWSFQEYVNFEGPLQGSSSWGVQAFQLRAPPPATPASANPATVCSGQSSVPVTITGTSTNGSEFFDPGPDTGGPGFANRIAGTVSGGVTVNSTTFDSITQVTLNISTAAATAGAKNVTITNPDGQSLTGTGILNLVAGPNISPASIPAGTVGTFYSQAFTGGTGFSLTGTLPTGMSFTPGNATLSGTPTQVGSFAFTLTATANGCQGSRSYVLTINCQAMTVSELPTPLPNGRVNVLYTATTFSQTGGIGATTLSLTGTLPSGLAFTPGTTGTLSGTPTQAGSFPIIVSAIDQNTCRRDKAYTLLITSTSGTAPFALAVDAAGNGVLDPTPTDTSVTVAPTWFNNSGGSITPTGTLGSPSAGLSLGADTAATYPTIGNNASGACTNCYTTVSAPGPRPGQHWDATTTETLASPADAKNWTLHVGGSFSDVPTSNTFYRFIETIFHKGVTSGCGANIYCPTSLTLRKQMARFLLRAKLGGGYTSPAPTGTVFGDVPINHPFAADIEDLASRKVTSGCSVSPPLFCPDNSVTRRQMAPFLLRALEGPAFVPAACATPPFNDVPTSDAFCPHIQELAVRQITLGCGGGNYCPTSPVTRGQMAAFLTRTFTTTLFLYGP